MLGIVFEIAHAFPIDPSANSVFCTSSFKFAKLKPITGQCLPHIYRCKTKKFEFITKFVDIRIDVANVY